MGKHMHTLYLVRCWSVDGILGGKLFRSLVHAKRYAAAHELYGWDGSRLFDATRLRWCAESRRNLISEMAEVDDGRNV